MKTRVLLRLWVILLGVGCRIGAGRGDVPGSTAEIRDLSVEGGLRDGKAKLTIIADLKGGTGATSPLLHSTELRQVSTVSRGVIRHELELVLEVLQGQPEEFSLMLGGGAGEVKSVRGVGLRDWSVRSETNGVRFLVLRPEPREGGVRRLAVTMDAIQRWEAFPGVVPVWTLTPRHPALMHGYWVLGTESGAGIQLKAEGVAGMIPVEASLLPEPMRGGGTNAAPALAYRVQGEACSLQLGVAAFDPDHLRVVLEDVQLEGVIGEASAVFRLRGVARVRNPAGGRLPVLGGGLALSDRVEAAGWRMTYEDRSYVAVYARPGEYPLDWTFHVPVVESNGWRRVEFQVAPGVLRPVKVTGIPADAEVRMEGGGRVETTGTGHRSVLASDGRMQLEWKPSRPEEEGRLFYSAEQVSQVVVGTGLMRQRAVMEARVMQGQLQEWVIGLEGPGSVTGVSGTDVLAWRVEPAGPGDTGARRLVVQFRRPQKAQVSVVIQIQTELGSLPLTAEVVRLRPLGATRNSGHVRVLNDGAVRLEVSAAAGLSQIAPEQFPETDRLRSLLGGAGSAGQRFAYRFSGDEPVLSIRADPVIPELHVSSVLVYGLAEAELSVDAEFEVDVREAPVREVTLRVPKGYSVVRLAVSGMTDSFVGEMPGEDAATLRVVFGQPVSGRQLMQLRLERNVALGGASWVLPRVEVLRARSARGHLGVMVAPGYRVSAERVQGMTEVATAYFPRKLPGLQLAFRWSEGVWQAGLRVERLPQTVQADVFHLFSIGEGIGFGSSTMHLGISGAPVSSLRVELSDEYFNVEFLGREVRAWQKVTNGYLVQLHTPVAGAYTLLATYERPFKAQGDTLTFQGARPLDAQVEQGHTVIVSGFQFQVRPVQVSPNLTVLEPAEVPAEHRLFFDAPILAAYRYTARPFVLQLGLSPLAQGDSVSLVIDRAQLRTRISKDGEVLTDATYFVKNRGNPDLRLAVADGTELWSVTVNGSTAVPVRSGSTNLIPLPSRTDPSQVQVVQVKTAARSRESGRVDVAAPVVMAPVLLADWRVEPDEGRRLLFRDGSLVPASGILDASGFGFVAQILVGGVSGSLVSLLAAALGLVILGVVASRWATGEGSRRFRARHVLGGFVGVGALVLACVALVQVVFESLRGMQGGGRELAFVAPIQQSGSALNLSLDNVPDRLTWPLMVVRAWPVVLAAGCHLLRKRTPQSAVRTRLVLGAAGWACLAWAILRWEHSAPAIFGWLLALVLFGVVVPMIRRLSGVRGVAIEAGRAATGAVVVLAGLLVAMGGGSVAGRAQEGVATAEADVARVAELVDEEIRVIQGHAVGRVRLRWVAPRGAILPLLRAPAVLTSMGPATNAVKVLRVSEGGRDQTALLALREGVIEMDYGYELPGVGQAAGAGEGGIALPTPAALVHRVSLVLEGLDADVVAALAASVERRLEGSNTVARLVVPPQPGVSVGWRPHSRDARREKPVYYSDGVHLVIPVAGVIEGIHQLQIRPAQGVVEELRFEVPAGMTITDVTDGAARVGTRRAGGGSEGVVTQWRYSPETRNLRVALSSPQSQAFSISIRSQVAVGAFPYAGAVGMIRALGVAGQMIQVGVATGAEVQLESVGVEGMTSINPEDFPGSLVPSAGGKIPGLVLRRAFRSGDGGGRLTVKVGAMEPDVRVEGRHTLSLGEDRTVLASSLSVAVTRAGIFRLSFLLPEGFEPESISGNALSHWTELVKPEGRQVTMHLKGRTEGVQAFALTLVGPGLKPVKGWRVPRLSIREASKQVGELLVVPEQGMRLQVVDREGVAQQDPQRGGVPQKGVMSFRLLQDAWRLGVDVDPVDSWIQVTGLQHVQVGEAQVKTSVGLQFQIENAGVKSFRIRLPQAAEGVRFRGEGVTDFLPVAGAVAGDLQVWEVRLGQRVLGRYGLSATYQVPSGGATNGVIRGVQVMDVNVQRGYLTLDAGGRLELRVGALPGSLQVTEWQSIPRVLLGEMPAMAASHAYRLVESDVSLSYAVERHETAKLLPARVVGVRLGSVISDEGVMLTEVRIELHPGDKRLLPVVLPGEATFWFAFVDRNGVWPWKEQDRVLIPLSPSHSGRPVVVELYYSSRIGRSAGRTFPLALTGPKFDLPLENITWNVFLNEKWRVTSWDGTLQLQEDGAVIPPVAVDVRSYLESETAQNVEKRREAEQMLSLGNSLLEKGDPDQARRAFQSAFGLSAHDEAFNEDARVQLHNLKLQQALVGLNLRQAAAAPDAEAGARRLSEWRSRKGRQYTQDEAKTWIEQGGGDAETGAALERVAEKLIQQQDAAVANPAAIRASIPHQGRMLVFRRAVQVDGWAELRIGLRAVAARPGTWRLRAGVLAVVFGLGLGVGLLSMALRRPAERPV